MPSDDQSIYVINGFYASMRSKFTSPGSSIYYFSVSWDAADLSWEDFRARVLGATDPETAAAGSMRANVLKEWESPGSRRSRTPATTACTAPRRRSRGWRSG